MTLRKCTWLRSPTSTTQISWITMLWRPLVIYGMWSCSVISPRRSAVVRLPRQAVVRKARTAVGAAHHLHPQAVILPVRRSERCAKTKA